MNRRKFLAASSGGLVLGSAGCLSTADGPATTTTTYADVTLDCERFMGMFGVLFVGIPGWVPDYATVIDIEETDLLEYDIVKAELERADETRSETDEPVDDFMLTGEAGLGNGDRYETIRASLNAYESTESERFGSRWYVRYEDDMYGLSLREQPLPWDLGYSADSSDSRLAMINVSSADSVPDDAAVIDALEENLDEHEHLGEVLTVAGCSDNNEDIPSDWEYDIPPDQYEEIRDLLGESRRSDGGWYVGYDGAVHHLSLSLGVE
jgi:hypothetical protein